MISLYLFIFARAAEKQLIYDILLFVFILHASLAISILTSIIFIDSVLLLPNQDLITVIGFYFHCLITP